MVYHDGMEVRFTKHAEEKFAVLKQHGLIISRTKVTETVLQPARVDLMSRSPLRIAQSDFDARRVLRVVYKVERDILVVITFYPGRKSQYEH